jgi:hypothetical protein
LVVGAGRRHARARNASPRHAWPSVSLTDKSSHTAFHHTHPNKTQGCGCDPGILSLVSAANADAGTLSGAVRLAQTSHCATAGPAGWANPCPGAASCLGAAATPPKKAPATAKAG